MLKFPVKLVLYIQLNKVTGNNLLSHSFLFLLHAFVIFTPTFVIMGAEITKVSVEI
jgi:hypothetical protein